MERQRRTRHDCSRAYQCQAGPPRGYAVLHDYEWCRVYCFREPENGENSGALHSVAISKSRARGAPADSRANRSARNRAVFSRKASPLAWYSAQAFSPSTSWISFFLKFASARSRPSFVSVFTTVTSIYG